MTSEVMDCTTDPREKNRRHLRKRVFKGASILVNGGRSTFDCIVKNFSDGGARVSMETTVDVPANFVLAISDGQSHQCQVRWRRLKELGVEFIDQSPSSVEGTLECIG